MARDPKQGGAAWEGSTLFWARIGTLNPVWRGALASGTAPWMMVADTRPCRRPAFRLMRRSHDFDAVHWDHEPRTSRKVPPTRCCRRLVGRASLRFLCRQDAGSTLGFRGSLRGIDAVHWDDEPVWVVPSVRSPAFRRYGPAKAGTPNRTPTGS